MSCPTVAGVVATYLQRYPNYTPRQIRDQLIADSTDGVVNMRTYRGGALASVVAQTTPNKFAYTGRCNNSEIVTVHIDVHVYEVWSYVILENQPNFHIHYFKQYQVLWLEATMRWRWVGGRMGWDGMG